LYTFAPSIYPKPSETKRFEMLVNNKKEFARYNQICLDEFINEAQRVNRVLTKHDSKVLVESSIPLKFYVELVKNIGKNYFDEDLDVNYERDNNIESCAQARLMFQDLYKEDIDWNKQITKLNSHLKSFEGDIYATGYFNLETYIAFAINGPKPDLVRVKVTHPDQEKLRLTKEIKESMERLLGN
jgi:hypothetical protein